MSRRQQQASLVKELQHRVQLTPLKQDDESGGVTSSPLASTLPPQASEGHDNAVATGCILETHATLAPHVAQSMPPKADEYAPDDAMTTPAPPVVTANGPTASVIVAEAVSAHSPRQDVRRVRLPSSRTDALGLCDTLANTASPRRVAVHVVASPKQQDCNRRAGSVPSAVDVQRLRELQESLAAETARRHELEAMVRELSATVHRQARELENERGTVRGLREEMALRTQRVASAARVPSPNRSALANKALPSSTASRLSASTPRNNSPIARNSSPSITRPTVSSARKSPLPQQRPSSVEPQRPRNMSPTAARQHLAASTFLQSTSASSARAVTTGKPAIGAQPARPRLGGAPSLYGSVSSAAVDVPTKRPSTTVVMQNGVVLSNTSGSLSAPRKITPARERVDAALERLVNGRLGRMAARK